MAVSHWYSWALHNCKVFVYEGGHWYALLHASEKQRKAQALEVFL